MDYNLKMITINNTLIIIVIMPPKFKIFFLGILGYIGRAIIYPLPPFLFILTVDPPECTFVLFVLHCTF